MRTDSHLPVPRSMQRLLLGLVLAVMAATGAWLVLERRAADRAVAPVPDAGRALDGLADAVSGKLKVDPKLAGDIAALKSAIRDTIEQAWERRAELRPGDADVSAAVTAALAERLAVAPSDLWMVGDSGNDVLAARAIGASAVAVSWGLTDRERLAALEPDVMIDEMGALLRLRGGA